MSKTALLFPGQGSQTPDMRDVLAEFRPDLLEAVSSAVGEDPFPRAEDSTRFAQPAIFCASLAHWEAKGKPMGELLAGHSLGELAALVVAGSLAEHDALELVALRGALMDDAGEQAGDGGMLALLGSGAADHAAELASAHGLALANDNSPQQVVLSGACSSLPAAASAAEDLGLRAMTLPVTGAFHSEMMRQAVPRLVGEARHEAAAVVELTHDPRDARVCRVEVGPGRVLSGLAKRTLRGVELVSA